MACWSASNINVHSWRGWLKENLQGTFDETEKLSMWTRRFRGEGAPTVKTSVDDQDDTELQKGKHVVHDAIASISEHIGRLRAALRHACGRTARAERAAERLRARKMAKVTRRLMCRARTVRIA